MIKMYAALGKMQVINKRPVVIKNGQEYHLTIEELIVWTSLMWSIFTYQELKSKYYRTEKQLHITSEVEFDDTLSRLERRKLIAVGSNLTDVETLYDLLSCLYIIPEPHINLATKTVAFIVYLVKYKLPFKNAVRIFNEATETRSEKSVLKLVSRHYLNTAQLIKCIDANIKADTTEESLLEKLYDTPDSTCDNMHISSFFSNSKNTAAITVANLFMKKKITFETSPGEQ